VILGRRRLRGGTRLALALIAATCVLAAFAAADDTTETTTYGKDGIATESLGLHFEETGFSSVVVRPDGGLVAQRDVQVESYLANGSPDPAVPPRQLPEYSRFTPVADGKSLILSYDKLTRLNSDGSVDTGFGGDGTVEAISEASAAELASGKILLARTAWGGTHERFAWVSAQLFNPDGSVDRAVGEDGALTVSIPYSNERTSELGIAPTGDGGALVYGGRILLRLRADGSPDPGFSGDGLVENLPLLAGARVLPDGSVVAVGTWDDTAETDLLLLRYTAAGTPDSGFGPDGIRRFDFGGEEEAQSALWAEDGSVIVGGSTQPPGTCFETETYCEEAPILAAFDARGGLESGFGTGGVLKLTALAGFSEGLYGSGVEALARRPDDTIVAAGSSPPEQTTAFLAAVSPQGALLPGFGEGGIVRVQKPVPADHTVTGFAPQAGGKLLAGGVSDLGFGKSAVLIRHAADGSLDRSFGDGGHVIVGKARFVHGFAAGDSGRVLMSIHDVPRGRLLTLRASDGARERSFGSDGAISLPEDVWVEQLGFGVDGGAIVLGTRGYAGNSEPGVVLRYRPNGRRDRGFGKGGRVELRLPDGRRMRARALASGGRGRILVAGVSRGRFVVTRLLPDGRRDRSFGTGGAALPGALGRALATPSGITESVALHRRGSRIYFAGVARQGKRLRVVLLRFNEDGSLDPAFGRGGRQVAPIKRATEPTAIVPVRNGTYVVLDEAQRPLLFFGRQGKVRHLPVGYEQRLISNVRATVSRGRLVLGWHAYSPTIERYAYYLTRR
jgi:uncharacterized delta-60 repeat protein